MTKLLIELLRKEIKLLDDAASILDRSFQICQRIGIKPVYTFEELDHLEALTSRFARLSDLLIQKIFRIIDQLDLETTGSIRDRINRAEKKGLILNAEIFIKIRILRNDIAHEYLPEAVQQIFESVMEWTPMLLQAARLTQDYSNKLIAKK